MSNIVDTLSTAGIIIGIAFIVVVFIILSHRASRRGL